MNCFAATLSVLALSTLGASAGEPADPAPGSIVQPVDVTTSYRQIFGNNLAAIRFGFDQSGLPPYDDGLTPFDDYISTPHANSNQSMMLVNSNGENAAQGVVEVGESFTLDLGTERTIDAVGIWTTNNARELINLVVVYAGTDPDLFSGQTVPLGVYALSPTRQGTALRFDAVETRFVHFEVLGHGGGPFVRIGEFAARIADRFDTPCLADLAAPQGLLDLADISAFLSAFTAGDPVGDLNSDGLHDLTDIALFVGAFQNGCD